MLLLNYDFHDIHSVLVWIRFKPAAPYNVEILQSVFEILTDPQVDHTMDDNIIRKKLRTVENIDGEALRWIYVDNIYTYGCKIIKNKSHYIFLANGFRLMLEYAKIGEFQRLADLADALHNIPILVAEGCKSFKRATNLEFLHYNKTYQTNLLKELWVEVL